MIGSNPTVHGWIGGLLQDLPSTSKSIGIVLLTGLSLTAIPMESRARDDSSSKAERAQKAFDRGAELFVKEEYATAIAKFRKAHHLEPSPVILFNIALAQRNLGKFDSALDTAQSASESEGLTDKLRVSNEGLTAGLASVIRSRRQAKRLARLEEQRVEHQEEPESEAPDETTEPTDKEQSQEEARAAGDEASDTTDQGAHAEGRTRSSSGGGNFGALGGVGVATSALGIGALVWTRLIVGQLETVRQQANTPGETQDFGIEEFRSRQQLGRVLMFGGTALFVTGATLVTLDLLVGSSENSERNARMGVSLGTDFASLSVEAAF